MSYKKQMMCNYTRMPAHSHLHTCSHINVKHNCELFSLLQNTNQPTIVVALRPSIICLQVESGLRKIARLSVAVHQVNLVQCYQ